MRYMRQISPRMYQRPKLARDCPTGAMSSSSPAALLIMSRHCALWTGIVPVWPFVASRNREGRAGCDKAHLAGTRGGRFAVVAVFSKQRPNQGCAGYQMLTNVPLVLTFARAANGYERRNRNIGETCVDPAAHGIYRAGEGLGAQG